MSFDMANLLSTSSRSSEMDLLRGVSNRSDLNPRESTSEPKGFEKRLSGYEDYKKPQSISSEKVASPRPNPRSKDSAVSERAREPIAPREKMDEVATEGEGASVPAEPVKEASLVDETQLKVVDVESLALAVMSRSISKEVKDDGREKTIDLDLNVLPEGEESVTAQPNALISRFLEHVSPKEGSQPTNLSLAKPEMDQPSEQSPGENVGMPLASDADSATHPLLAAMSEETFPVEEGLFVATKPSAESGSQDHAPSLKRFADDLFISKSLGVESMSPQRTDAEFSVDAPLAARPVKIVDQIEPVVTKLALNAKGGDMTLKLYPAHLGAVKVQVQVHETQVKIHFEAEKAMTQNLIREQASDLKSQLSSKGLRVDEIQVASSGSSSVDGTQRSQASSERGQSQWDHGPQREAREQKEQPRQERGRDSNGNFESHFEERNAA